MDNDEIMRELVRLRSRVDALEAREKARFAEKNRRLAEIKNLLGRELDMAAIMLVMNLLIAVDVSDGSKKRLYQMYVEIQGAMMTMGGGRNMAKWHRELLDIIRMEIGESEFAANQKRISAVARQITNGKEKV